MYRIPVTKSNQLTKTQRLEMILKIPDKLTRIRIVTVAIDHFSLEGIRIVLQFALDIGIQREKFIALVPLRCLKQPIVCVSYHQFCRYKE